MSRLYYEVGGGGPSVVLLHGFTQTLRSWQPLALQLQSTYRVAAVDAPGHGKSAETHLGLTTTADLLARELGPSTYVGYSMGARLALHIAVRHPDSVHRLVLLGGTAGLAESGDQAERAVSDERLATELEQQGVTAFLDRWLAQPMFANVPDDRADRLRNTVSGLAASLRLAGTGAQDSLWHKLGELTMPVLVLAGDKDAKFTDIGRRMVQTIGKNATFSAVPNAGHAAHLEQPEAFLDLLTTWLAGHPIRH